MTRRSTANSWPTSARFFAYRDANDLIVQVRDLLHAPNTLARLLGAAGRRVVERHSWDTVTDAYEAYFADFVAGESTPR